LTEGDDSTCKTHLALENFHPLPFFTFHYTTNFQFCYLFFMQRFAWRLPSKNVVLLFPFYLNCASKIYYFTLTDLPEVDYSFMLSVSLHITLIIFECLNQFLCILVKYIEAPKPISTSHFINSSHQLGKNVTSATNTHAKLVKVSSHYGDRLCTHPNHLAVNLLRLPDNRRLRRFLPADLPDRF
jgi:hypothetical protein